MKYIVFDNRIEIEESDDFSAQDILECGQVFRYKKTEKGYEVITGSHKARVETEKGKTIIWGDPKIFENYFDLKTDYQKIKCDLGKFENMKEAINFGKGIRILKQVPLETLFFFIISANNNIPRIKNTIEKLCTQYGTMCEDYYAFPTLEQLLQVSEEFWKNAGAGYRAKYLVRVAKQVSENPKLLLSDGKTEDLKKRLLTLSGVGPKVADCVLLFGFGRTDVFPTDTWILQAIGETNKSKAEKCSNEKAHIFGSLAGYAQQYMFYYIRNKK